MKAENAVEWFEENGGVLARAGPLSIYPLPLSSVKLVTVEQAERYACEFAAEQLQEAYHAGTHNIRQWLYDRIVELKGLGGQL